MNQRREVFFGYTSLFLYENTKMKAEPKKAAVNRRLRIKGRFLKKETELLLREFAYIA